MRSVVQRVARVDVDPYPREVVEGPGVLARDEDRLHGVQRRTDGQQFARQQRVLAAAADVQARDGHEIVSRHEVCSCGAVAPSQLPRSRRLLEREHHVWRELAFEELRRSFALELLALGLFGVASRAYENDVSAALLNWRVVMHLPAAQQVVALGASIILL